MSDLYKPLDDSAALALADVADTAALAHAAAWVRDMAHDRLITYSRKAFLPLTHLCRDVCHYCTFAQAPRQVRAPYMSVDDVLKVARTAAQLGCKEALFTLGERPELRYSAARDALAEMGFDTTLAYVAHVAETVLKETGLLPHINAGTMTAAEMTALRRVSASMGLMLESVSPRLCEKGGPHYGSPDKDPAVRLATIRQAGELAVPFTSGILIGIGETRRERIESLLALRRLHEEFGHIQEIIIQNFRAKPGTRMANHPEPSLDDLRWTIAVARLIFGPLMSIQAPPNLSPGVLPELVAAGLNDWGGVSPLTPDFVNPEAPWPHIEQLARATAAAGKTLVERLTIYPAYAQNLARWADPAMHRAILRLSDASGRARAYDWQAGAGDDIPVLDPVFPTGRTSPLHAIIAKAENGDRLEAADIVRLFDARGEDAAHICHAADALRRKVCGDTVRYVVNRNINYTNVCAYKCQFCAFSKGSTHDDLRGKPYDLSADEITRRVVEAWDRGATEVCLQGGIKPGYTGETYLDIVRLVKSAAPRMHVHAFSPLEVWHGAQTLGLSLHAFLERLQAAGLGSLPGTAAEILSDDVRRILCPDKLNTEQWLRVIRTAHDVGLPTTATIMYGHVEHPRHWAAHLLHIRDLQAETGGFTEFVPLPFVSMEAPLYRKGRARPGPTYREAVMMHAVARLVLHPLIPNIQTSWVKMGPEGAAACLGAGANDMGGTLMNESITRAAGASHGQEFAPAAMDKLIRACGRLPQQRTTLYGQVSPEQSAKAYGAAPLAPTEQKPFQAKQAVV